MDHEDITREKYISKRMEEKDDQVELDHQQLLMSPMKQVKAMTFIQSMQSTEKDTERLTMPDTQNMRLITKIEGIVVENVADLLSYDSQG